MMKKHIKMSEKVFRGGLGLFWSSNEVKMTKCCLVCIRAQAPLEEAWVLWWVPKCVNIIEKDLWRHNLTCFHHFWALFCLKPTRNALFRPFFCSKLPSGRYEASSNWIFAPRSILSPRMTSDPKDGLSRHKIHLISSFLGFILPKSDQKCTF